MQTTDERHGSETERNNYVTSAGGETLSIVEASRGLHHQHKEEKEKYDSGASFVLDTRQFFAPKARRQPFRGPPVPSFGVRKSRVRMLRDGTHILVSSSGADTLSLRRIPKNIQSAGGIGGGGGGAHRFLENESSDVGSSQSEDEDESLFWDRDAELRKREEAVDKANETAVHLYTSDGSRVVFEEKRVNLYTPSVSGLQQPRSLVKRSFIPPHSTSKHSEGNNGNSGLDDKADNDENTVSLSAALGKSPTTTGASSPQGGRLPPSALIKPKHEFIPCDARSLWELLLNADHAIKEAKVMADTKRSESRQRDVEDCDAVVELTDASGTKAAESTNGAIFKFPSLTKSEGGVKCPSRSATHSNSAIAISLATKTINLRSLVHQHSSAASASSLLPRALVGSGERGEGNGNDPAGSGASAVDLAFQPKLLALRRLHYLSEPPKRDGERDVNKQADSKISSSTPRKESGASSVRAVEFSTRFLTAPVPVRCPTSFQKRLIRYEILKLQMLAGVTAGRGGGGDGATVGGGGVIVDDSGGTRLTVPLVSYFQLAQLERKADRQRELREEIEATLQLKTDGFGGGGGADKKKKAQGLGGAMTLSPINQNPLTNMSTRRISMSDFKSSSNTTALSEKDVSEKMKITTAGTREPVGGGQGANSGVGVVGEGVLQPSSLALIEAKRARVNKALLSSVKPKIIEDSKAIVNNLFAKTAPPLIFAPKQTEFGCVNSTAANTAKPTQGQKEASGGGASTALDESVIPWSVSKLRRFADILNSTEIVSAIRSLFFSLTSKGPITPIIYAALAKAFFMSVYVHLNPAEICDLVLLDLPLDYVGGQRMLDVMSLTDVSPKPPPLLHIDADTVPALSHHQPTTSGLRGVPTVGHHRSTKGVVGCTTSIPLSGTASAIEPPAPLSPAARASPRQPNNHQQNATNDVDRKEATTSGIPIDSHNKDEISVIGPHETPPPPPLPPPYMLDGMRNEADAHKLPLILSSRGHMPLLDSESHRLVRPATLGKNLQLPPLTALHSATLFSRTDNSSVRSLDYASFIEVMSTRPNTYDANEGGSFAQELPAFWGHAIVGGVSEGAQSSKLNVDEKAAQGEVDESTTANGRLLAMLGTIEHARILSDGGYQTLEQLQRGARGGRKRWPSQAKKRGAGDGSEGTSAVGVGEVTGSGRTLTKRARDRRGAPNFILPDLRQNGHNSKNHVYSYDEGDEGNGNNNTNNEYGAQRTNNNLMKSVDDVEIDVDSQYSSQNPSRALSLRLRPLTVEGGVRGGGAGAGEGRKSPSLSSNGNINIRNLVRLGSEAILRGLNSRSTSSITLLGAGRGGTGGGGHDHDRDSVASDWDDRSADGFNTDRSRILSTGRRQPPPLRAKPLGTVHHHGHQNFSRKSPKRLLSLGAEREGNERHRDARDTGSSGVTPNKKVNREHVQDEVSTPPRRQGESRSSRTHPETGPATAVRGRTPPPPMPVSSSIPPDTTETKGLDAAMKLLRAADSHPMEFVDFLRWLQVLTLTWCEKGTVAEALLFLSELRRFWEPLVDVLDVAYFPTMLTKKRDLLFDVQEAVFEEEQLPPGAARRGCVPKGYSHDWFSLQLPILTDYSISSDKLLLDATGRAISASLSARAEAAAELRRNSRRRGESGPSPTSQLAPLSLHQAHRRLCGQIGGWERYEKPYSNNPLIGVLNPSISMVPRNLRRLQRKLAAIEAKQRAAGGQDDFTTETITTVVHRTLNAAAGRTSPTVAVRHAAERVKEEVGEEGRHRLVRSQSPRVATSTSPFGVHPVAEERSSVPARLSLSNPNSADTSPPLSPKGGRGRGGVSGTTAATFGSSQTTMLAKDSAAQPAGAHEAATKACNPPFAIAEKAVSARNVLDAGATQTFSTSNGERGRGARESRKGSIKTSKPAEARRLDGCEEEADFNGGERMTATDDQTVTHSNQAHVSQGLIFASLGAKDTQRLHADVSTIITSPPRALGTAASIPIRDLAAPAGQANYRRVVLEEVKLLRAREEAARHEAFQSTLTTFGESVYKMSRKDEGEEKSTQAQLKGHSSCSLKDIRADPNAGGNTLAKETIRGSDARVQVREVRREILPFPASSLSLGVGTGGRLIDPLSNMRKGAEIVHRLI